jgi:hypothetical protein
LHHGNGLHGHLLDTLVLLHLQRHLLDVILWLLDLWLLQQIQQVLHLVSVYSTTLTGIIALPRDHQCDIRLLHLLLHWLAGRHLLPRILLILLTILCVIPGSICALRCLEACANHC